MSDSIVYLPTYYFHTKFHTPHSNYRIFVLILSFLTTKPQILSGANKRGKKDYLEPITFFQIVNGRIVTADLRLLKISRLKSLLLVVVIVVVADQHEFLLAML